MQGTIYFYRKGTGTFLPAKYAFAAAVYELPFEKESGRGSGKR